MASILNRHGSSATLCETCSNSTQKEVNKARTGRTTTGIGTRQWRAGRRFVTTLRSLQSRTHQNLHKRRTIPAGTVHVRKYGSHSNKVAGKGSAVSSLFAYSNAPASGRSTRAEAGKRSNWKEAVRHVLVFVNNPRGRLQRKFSVLWMEICCFIFSGGKQNCRATLHRWACNIIKSRWQCCGAVAMQLNCFLRDD